MRVRVRFRYRADTGEVEVFTVDDIADGPPAVDHDARHDAATRDVARVVDPYALIDEVTPAAAPPPPLVQPPAPEAPGLPDGPLRDQ